MNEQPSKWTLDSLYELFQQRIRDLNEKICVVSTSQEKSFLAAQEVASKRLDSMNEFRGALTDQAKTLVSRSEADILHRALDARITKLENFRSEQVGGSREVANSRERAEWGVGQVLTGVGLIITLILGALAFIFKSQ